MIYTVTLRFQFPDHDERDGISWEVSADTKLEANKKARRLAERDGHLFAMKGRTTFTARLEA